MGADPTPAQGPPSDAPAAAATTESNAIAPASSPELAGTAGRSIRTIYKILAALLGVVSSATGLIFAFAPGLVPTGDAPVQAAELSDLSVDAEATFGKYLARIDQPAMGYTEQQLRRRGAILDFRVQIEGFKGKTLLLKWEVFDAEGSQVNESKAIRITPTNERNEATWQFWVPLPKNPGRYVAFVELIEQKKNHLLKLASLETGELHGVG